MGHARPGRGTGEGGAAGIPEQVKHPDRPAGSPDEDGHPLPVDGLFREQAGMLEAHGFETEPQPRKARLRSVVSDLPHVGQRAQPFPMAAARPRAVITGMSFLPERVGPGVSHRICGSGRMRRISPTAPAVPRTRHPAVRNLSSVQRPSWMSFPSRLGGPAGFPTRRCPP